jgi:hypothetical protein
MGKGLKSESSPASVSSTTMVLFSLARKGVEDALKPLRPFDD